MKRPKKAFLLAAGYGTRMRPITDDLPKPMMPIWGRPAIARVIDLLQGWGVKEIVVNLHHNPGPVFDFLRDRTSADLRIDISFEPEILGTGGALRKAKPLLNDGNPFWVVNTDIAADLSPLPFLREMEKKKPVSVLWMHPEKGPRTVEMKGTKIQDFASSSPGKAGTFTFCGLQLVRPELFDYLEDESVFTIVEGYRRAIKDKKRISGVVVKNSFWADLGTPEQYLDAHADILTQYRNKGAGSNLFDSKQLRKARDLRKQGVSVAGFVALGENVKVAKGVSLKDSVLLDNSKVRRGVKCERTVLGRGTDLYADSNGVVLSAGAIKDDLIAHVLSVVGMDRDTALVAPVSGGRGSARSFTRLIDKNGSCILIRYTDERAENYLFAGHASFLKSMRINVPEIISHLPENNAVVIEDLGDDSLESFAKSLDAKEQEQAYKAVLDQLLVLHGVSGKDIKQSGVVLEEPFGKSLYRWERELMADHFLSGRIGEERVAKVIKEIKKVAEKLLNCPDVLLHRDMQSSNVLFSESSTKPYFIDFQGMRMGPAVYDLASLLCDPYVMLSEKVQLRLLDYYASRSSDPDKTVDCFWYGAVERLVQALGAFGRLSAIPGTKRFERHIQPALVMLKRALSHIDDLTALKKLVNELLD